MGDYSYCKLNIRAADLPLFEQIFKNSGSNYRFDPEIYDHENWRKTCWMNFEELRNGCDNPLFNKFIEAQLSFTVDNSGCDGVWHQCCRAVWFGEVHTIYLAEGSYYLPLDRQGNYDPEILEDTREEIKFCNKVEDYVNDVFRGDDHIVAEVAKHIMLGHAR